MTPCEHEWHDWRGRPDYCLKCTMTRVEWLDRIEREKEIEGHAQHQKPCATCPFSRAITPGELGGSPWDVYVGQTEAGFAIPCHSCIDYDDPDWKTKAGTPGTVGQCAGAAIYRSNIGRPNSRILVLPADKVTVFGSHAEFLSHHEGLDLDGAEALLTLHTPADCVDFEMRRAGLQVHLVKRPERISKPAPEEHDWLENFGDHAQGAN